MQIFSYFKLVSLRKQHRHATYQEIIVYQSRGPQLANHKYTGKYRALSLQGSCLKVIFLAIINCEALHFKKHIYAVNDFSAAFDNVICKQHATLIHFNAYIFRENLYFMAVSHKDWELPNSRI